MAGKKMNYFVRANSSQGLVNLLYSNVVGLETGIILKGTFDVMKQDALASLSRFMTDTEYSCECIHSIYEPDALEGIIIREKGIGIFNDQIITPAALKLFTNTIYVDLDVAIDETFAEIKEYLYEDKDFIQKKYAQAYAEFAEAILIHDDWERIYISHMHFDKADEFTEEIINDLFKNAPEHTNGQTRHRFFGGATYKGSVDFVKDLTKNLERRYFIKGRPGSGKSTLLRKVQSKAESLGYDVDVYHCGFDPNSLDMIVVPDLNFCIFDSTAPHEYFPSTSNDYVLDMYAVSIDAETDEKYQDELDEIITGYKAKVALGTSYMLETKQLEKKMNHDLYHFVRMDILYEKFHEIQNYINTDY